MLALLIFIRRISSGTVIPPCLKFLISATFSSVNSRLRPNLELGNQGQDHEVPVGEVVSIEGSLVTLKATPFSLSTTTAERLNRQKGSA
jgi:hypothetical protein